MKTKSPVKWHYCCLDRCELKHIEVTKRLHCKYCGATATREICDCPPKIMILGAKK